MWFGRSITVLLAGFAVFLTGGPIYSQTIVINEFMASNGATVTDEDQDYSDWIELYNAGAETVDLEGWGLTDDPGRPFRWVFPRAILYPGNHLLVWASDKNRRPSEDERANGILREVFTGISGTSVTNLTSHPNYPDNPAAKNLVTDFFEAPINAGDNYGQRMHGYILAPTTGSYIFWIASDDNSHLYLSSNENPANAVRIARVTGYTSSRQWNKFPADQQSAPIPLQAGQYYYISALMKEGTGGDNLAVRWQLQDGTIEEPIPAERLFVDVQELHTNFAISAAGETLMLTAPDGTVVDSVEPRVMFRDISYGRAVDGGAEWVFFKDATPNASNQQSIGYSDVLLPPVFSRQGGFSLSPFDLTLSAPDPSVVIRYTLDGSVPDENSAVFSGPLLITERHHEQNLIADIQTTPYFDPTRVDTDYVAVFFKDAITWMPPPPVKKATVVRAAAFKPGAIPSDSATHTYWVGSDIATRFTLPVVSLTTDAGNLFDPDYGIYVPGATFVNSNPARPWHSSPANYRNRGDAWERPIHVAFYDTDGTLWLEQEAGVRLHGGATRSMSQKTLRLYARDDYDGSAFQYPLFSDRPHLAYKRLLLRNGGNDWNLTLFRDALAHRVVGHMSADTQAYRPMVVYINGEYWGIHNLRQRYDKHHLAQTYGVDSESLDFRDGSTAAEGDAVHYNSLSSYVSANDMADPVHFAEVETRMDIDNFIDYFIAQMFTRNTDWPGNNIACWRLRVPYDPNAAYGQDGRWRWLLFDLDFGYGYAGGANDYTFNMFSTARGHTIFNRLLNNAQFRQRFITRFADQLNTAFLPGRILGLIDELQAGIAAEMPHHIERWQRPASMEQWQTRVDVMKTFAANRANSVRGHIRSQFGLGADCALTVNVSDAAQGFVRVNRTDITAATPGVNALSPYPWSGVYFAGVPVTVTAAALPGYVFSHWSGPAGIDPQSATQTLSLTGAVTLTAHFEPAPVPTLMHYWSFNAAASLLSPSYTFGGASLAVAPGATTEVLSGTGQDFAGLNNRLDEAAGAHLRVNNPLGASMTLTVPTTGFEDIVLAYETRRSGQGAGTQQVSYSTDGTTFVPFRMVVVSDAAPVVQTFDLSAIAAADHNPHFAVRIEFAQGSGGSEGNNRFDNITVDGIPLAGVNQPPQLVEPLTSLVTLEGAAPAVFDLTTYIGDPDQDVLSLTAISNKPFVAEAVLANGLLTVTPKSRGDAVIAISADDGVNPPLVVNLRVLVYPAAQTLRLGTFRFEAWSPEIPEHTFPASMLFLQSDVIDPGLDQTLDYAYFIPHDDYQAADAGVIGYPYKATGRTRINGLNEAGISFINTGRERDLGGALAALDTTGLEAVRVSWLGGTILENVRRYAIRLQYRVGIAGPFTDVRSNGQPVEYLVQANGHTQGFGPIELPAEAADQPYVQLLWKYYYVDGLAGARAQLRLDDITVSGVLDLFGNVGLMAQWWLATECGQYAHCDGADLTRDGRVDLEDFAVLAAQWVRNP